MYVAGRITAATMLRMKARLNTYLVVDGHRFCGTYIAYPYSPYSHSSYTAEHREARALTALWLPPDVTLTIETDSGELLRPRTGEDLVKAFEGNLATLTSLVTAIFEENTFSAEQKKRRKSRSSSSPSLSAPSAAGRTPAATVDAVATPASAPSVPASDHPAATPSSSRES
jgi:hypothetical protein